MSNSYHSIFTFSYDISHFDRSGAKELNLTCPPLRTSLHDTLVGVDMTVDLADWVQEWTWHLTSPTEYRSGHDTWPRRLSPGLVAFPPCHFGHTEVHRTTKASLHMDEARIYQRTVVSALRAAMAGAECWWRVWVCMDTEDGWLAGWVGVLHTAAPDNTFTQASVSKHLRSP